MNRNLEKIQKLDNHELFHCYILFYKNTTMYTVKFQVLYATEDGFAVPEDEAGLDDGVPPPPHPEEVAEEY